MGSSSAASPSYRTIVADPPWEYAEPYASYIGPRTKRRKVRKELPFDQMTTERIAAINVPARPDAHLWLWTTNRYLRDAYTVMNSWGFQFRQIIVWRKTGSPSPFCASVAPNHAEFLLFGVRGVLRLNGQLKSNVIDAQRQHVHSRKPEVFLDLVEQVSPGPYLEMFSRRARLGWDTWGDEALHGTELIA